MGGPPAHGGRRVSRTAAVRRRAAGPAVRSCHPRGAAHDARARLHGDRARPRRARSTGRDHGHEDAGRRHDRHRPRPHPLRRQRRTAPAGRGRPRAELRLQPRVRLQLQEPGRDARFRGAARRTWPRGAGARRPSRRGAARPRRRAGGARCRARPRDDPQQYRPHGFGRPRAPGAGTRRRTGGGSPDGSRAVGRHVARRRRGTGAGGAPDGAARAAPYDRQGVPRLPARAVPRGAGVDRGRRDRGERRVRHPVQ